MKLLDDYFDIQKKIFEYFGYEESWECYPLDDKRDSYWMIVDNQVIYSDTLITEESIKSEELYCADGYAKNDWIFRSEEYTILSVDTRTDGNKFLMILDNSKECVDSKMKTLYKGY